PRHPPDIPAYPRTRPTSPEAPDLPAWQQPPRSLALLFTVVLPPSFYLPPPMELRDQARKAIERYEEIEHRLQSPDVLADQAKVRDLSKQHKDLHETVERARDYLGLLDEYDGWLKARDDSGDAGPQEMARDEAERIEESLPDIEQTLALLFVPRDPADARGAVLEVRAGTGGDEASLFAGDLFRMYQYYCESRGWRIEILSSHEGTSG